MTVPSAWSPSLFPVVVFPTPSWLSLCLAPCQPASFPLHSISAVAALLAPEIHNLHSLVSWFGFREYLYEPTKTFELV